MHKCFPLKCNRCSIQSTCFGAFVLILYIWFSLQAHVFDDRIISVLPFQFMWFKNASRNVSHYISKEKTTLLEPENVCPHPIDFLIMVPSAPANINERNVIRQTWGTWVDKTHADHKSTTKLFFMLGLTSRDSNNITDPVYSESSIYGDIIVEDFFDSYLNLTLKTVFILKWVQTRCPDIKFLLKADDDMFINVPILITSMSAMNLPKKCLVGSIICNAMPIHNILSKWYTPLYMYNKKRYPTYLSGTAYAISGGVVSDLYSTALQTPYFHLEDIFLTGFCAEQLHITVMDHPGFSRFQSPNDPCLSINFVSRHELNSTAIAKRWDQLHDPVIVRNCKRQKVKKPNICNKNKRFRPVRGK